MDYFKIYTELVGIPTINKPIERISTVAKIKKNKTEDIIDDIEDVDIEPDEADDTKESSTQIDDSLTSDTLDTQDQANTKRRVTIRNWLYKLNSQFKPFARFKYDKQKKYFAMKPTGEDEYLLIYPNEEDEQDLRNEIAGTDEGNVNEKILDEMLKAKDTKDKVYDLIKNRAQEILKRYEDVKDRTITENYNKSRRKALLKLKYPINEQVNNFTKNQYTKIVNRIIKIIKERGDGIKHIPETCYTNFYPSHKVFNRETEKYDLWTADSMFFTIEDYALVIAVRSNGYIYIDGDFAGGFGDRDEVFDEASQYRYDKFRDEEEKRMTAIDKEHSKIWDDATPEQIKNNKTFIDRIGILPRNNIEKVVAYYKSDDAIEIAMIGYGLSITINKATLTTTINTNYINKDTSIVN